ncbi:MAG: alpha/beta hydrolase [Myxococcota bacterium]
MPVDPLTQAFVDTVVAAGGPPLYTLTPDAARRVLAQAQAGNVPKLPADIEDATFPVGPTGSVRVRLVRPPGARGKLPAVVYLHGGGWILGDLETHDRLVREIANGAGVTVVMVDYERSPEARYPVSVEQAYAVTRFVAEHADVLAIDRARLAVAGDSAGGQMATAVALLAKERKGPKLAFQVLLYPVTDADFDTPSYRQFADGPWLTREAMKWFWNAYCPDVARRGEPLASPLRASADQLSGLPPTLVITGENDVLRDEGEAFASKLAQAGVRVTSVRYNGTIHDFLMLDGLRDTPAARAAIALTNELLRQTLGASQPQGARVPEVENV